MITVLHKFSLYYLAPCVSLAKILPGPPWRSQTASWSCMETVAGRCCCPPIHFWSWTVECGMWCWWPYWTDYLFRTWNMGGTRSCTGPGSCPGPWLLSQSAGQAGGRITAAPTCLKRRSGCWHGSLSYLWPKKKNIYFKLVKMILFMSLKQSIEF